MTRILFHVLTVGLEWATCCLSNLLKFNLGKIVYTEHATNKKCKESQCSREQWAHGKTSAPPSYVQQELFFPFRKTLVIYLFYSVWASSWEKTVLEEMGFVPQESVVGTSGLKSPTCWSTAMELDPGSSQGCSQALPCCPLLTQHSLCLHSLHMGTSVFLLLQAFMSPKPPQVITSDIKGVNQVWETSLLILPE